MAIKPNARYPGKTIAPSTEYPLGKARNVTVPKDGTGTPWEADIVNDLFGFLQNLLTEASIAASGNPDKVGTSQYSDAIREIIRLRLLAGLPANLGDLKIQDGTNPQLVFSTTSGDTDFNQTALSHNGAQLAMHTRNSVGTPISTDYLQQRNASGATSHSWRIGGVEKILVNVNGITVDGDVTVGANSFIMSANTGVLYNSGNPVLKQSVSSNNEAGIESVGSIIFNIDTNNTNSGKSFQWRHNGEGYGGSALMALADTSVLTLYGDSKIVSGAINFGQDDLDYYEGGLNFTPTFNAAPTATVRSGKAIKIGNKVDVYIRLEGTAAQRAALGSGVSLDIGNIPFISELTSERNGFVSVTERLGAYFYEDRAESQSGLVSAANDVIHLWHQDESVRTIKTVGDWASGDFYFNIHASFITD